MNAKLHYIVSLSISFLTFSLLDYVRAAEVPGNIAPNFSFEELADASGKKPLGWDVFSNDKNAKIELTDKLAASGRQSLKMTATGVAKGYQGVNFSLPVSEGEKYSFDVQYIGDKDDRPGGTMDLRLVIEWKRMDGSEISRTSSTPIKAPQISRLRWETLSLKKVPVPKDAVNAVFGIHLCDNERPGSGTVYVDDVVILKH